MHRIIIYSIQGNIALFNVRTRAITKQIATNCTIGYCGLGVYNGVTELYVPRDDGWVFIYDATTLQQIDQI